MSYFPGNLGNLVLEIRLQPSEKPSRFPLPHSNVWSSLRHVLPSLVACADVCCLCIGLHKCCLLVHWLAQMLFALGCSVVSHAVVCAMVQTLTFKLLVRFPSLPSLICRSRQSSAVAKVPVAHLLPACSRPLAVARSPSLNNLSGSASSPLRSNCRVPPAIISIDLSSSSLSLPPFLLPFLPHLHRVSWIGWQAVRPSSMQLPCTPGLQHSFSYSLITVYPQICLASVPQ